MVSHRYGKAIIVLRQQFGESKESLRQYDVVAVQATTIRSRP